MKCVWLPWLMMKAKQYMMEKRNQKCDVMDGNKVLFTMFVINGIKLLSLLLDSDSGW